MVDWILMLAIATFVVVIAFLYWTKKSAENHKGAGGEGIGGANDPLSGATGDLRSPREMTEAMDRAASSPHVGLHTVDTEQKREPVA